MKTNFEQIAETLRELAQHAETLAKVYSALNPSNATTTTLAPPSETETDEFKFNIYAAGSTGNIIRSVKTAKGARIVAGRLAAQGTQISRISKINLRTRATVEYWTPTEGWVVVK